MLILQVMLVDRGGNYKFIFAKRDKTAVWFVKGISHQSQIHTAVQNSCYSAETVGLPGVKIYVWNLAGEGAENTWQKVGGRNCGNSQVNNFFILSGELFYNVAAHVQHIGGAVIEQKTALGDVQLLGGADQQPRIQFLFQGIDVGTDGGLGQIQLAGGFGEAFIFDYGYEGF